MISFIESFKKYAINYDGIFLFTPDIALEIIDQAESKKIRILGLDAFKLKLNFIQPWMENSIDLSKKNGGGWPEARQLLIAKKDLGFFFEIIVEDLDDKRAGIIKGSTPNNS